MFYAHIVLAKKGPFARIWLAAHWDKKLTKAQVFETNIEQSVEGIMQPKVKLALRTSGHLLLGVVRIYSRKAKYLLADCNEAFVKIKMAFRPGMVDLPEEHREAAVNAITLPEVFHDFDTALPDLNDLDIEAQFSINQSRADEITMREDYGSIPVSIHDEGFGDMALDEADIGVGQSIDLADDLEGGGRFASIANEASSRSMFGSLDAPDANDGFGDAMIGNDGFGEPLSGGGLFGNDDLFGDAPMAAAGAAIGGAARSAADSDDDMMDDGGGGWQEDGGGGGGSSGRSSPIEFLPTSPPSKERSTGAPDSGRLNEFDAALRPDAAAASAAACENGDDGLHTNDENDRNALNQHDDLLNGVDGIRSAHGDEASAAAGAGNQTTLLHNEEESFALAPVDASALKGVPKAKRKRKLIVDEVKNISGEEMKSQLADTSDIITTLDLAPPTKRLMYWKETGNAEKVFTMCSRDIMARVLFHINQRHFQLRPHHLDDFSQLGPADVLALDQYQHDAEAAAATQATVAANGRRGRKRKLASVLESPPPTTAAAMAADSITALVEHHRSMDDLVERLDGSGRDNRQLPLPDADASADKLVSIDASAVDDSSMLNRNVVDGVSLQASSLEHTPISALDMSELPEIADDLLARRDDQSRLGGAAAGVDLLGGALHDVGRPDMTPGYSEDFGGAGDLHSPAYAPSFDGGITPHHAMVEQLDSIPNLPADQLQSILNDDGPPSAGDRLAQDWADSTDAGSSFDFPPEVATHQPGDEQLENETDEQFEERVLNKRAAQMFISVRTRMQQVDQLYLSEMTRRNNRKQAAQKFYSLLVLKKFRALDISQEQAYGDILVTKGTMFDNPKL